MDYQKLADKLLELGDRHSAPYREGMIAALKRSFDRPGEVRWLNVPYAEGTVEFDAFFAGCRRGLSEWHEVQWNLGNDEQKTRNYFENLVKETA